MNIHEWQARKILSSYGVKVSNFKVARTAEDVLKAAKELKASAEFPVVVKVQVHSGGRGKAGGVKLVKSPKEAFEVAKNLLSKKFKTYQNPEGLPVNALIVAEAVSIKKEFYIAFTVDRETETIVLIASSEGGVEIENLPPEKIVKEYIEPLIGLQHFQARKIAYLLGLEDKASELANILMKLYKIFTDLDCSLVEINPLVLTTENDLVAIDCKIQFDDNALFRHEELLDYFDPTQINEFELEAKKFGLSFVKLDGNTGCMVNGAGLAMATMDEIKQAGGNPANFLDIGGSATVDRIKEAIRILVSDKNVKVIFINIFGGIVRCDRIAKGVLEAKEFIPKDMPIVIRMDGTNYEEGKKLLETSKLNITFVKNMKEGAQVAVKIAGGDKK